MARETEPGTVLWKSDHFCERNAERCSTTPPLTDVGNGHCSACCPVASSQPENAKPFGATAESSGTHGTLETFWLSGTQKSLVAPSSRYRSEDEQPLASMTATTTINFLILASSDKQERYQVDFP